MYRLLRRLDARHRAGRAERRARERVPRTSAGAASRSTTSAGHTSADLGSCATRRRACSTPGTSRSSTAPRRRRTADIPLWRDALDRARGDRSRGRSSPGGTAPRTAAGESLEQTADWLDWLDGTLREAVAAGLTMNEAMTLPIPERLARARRRPHRVRALGRAPLPPRSRTRSSRAWTPSRARASRGPSSRHRAGRPLDPVGASDRLARLESGPVRPPHGRMRIGVRPVPSPPIAPRRAAASINPRSQAIRMKRRTPLARLRRLARARCGCALGTRLRRRRLDRRADGRPVDAR